MLLAWLLVHLAVGLVIWTLSPGAETVWFHVARWLTATQDSDSWKPIEIAYAHGAVSPASVYDDVFFAGGTKFQYPLTALTLFGGVSRPLLNVLSWSAAAATACLCAVLLHGASVTASCKARASMCFESEPALYALSIVAALTFYPVLKAYSLGQIQTLVTAAFALFLLTLQRGRPAWAGCMLGLMLLIKPGCAPLLVWGAARRRWTLVLAAIATVLAGVVVSIPRYPLAAQVQYLRVLSFLSERGEVFAPNQSVNGLLNRWVNGGGSLEWHPDAFAPPNPVVAIGTTVTFVLMFGAALWLVPSRSRGTPLDASVTMLAATMGAPIAWEHHYGILAPALAATWPAIATVRPLGRYSGPVLFVTVLVLANYVQAANRFDGTWLNPLQSYVLAAALVLFALLVRTARLQPA
jgi:alpha-1,2-mannosyltransferase